MSTATGRVAAFYGHSKPMIVKEYPVPDPEPGAVVVRSTVANICGSDLHQWRGGFDVVKVGRPLPPIPRHEKTGTGPPPGPGLPPGTKREAPPPRDPIPLLGLSPPPPR